MFSKNSRYRKLTDIAVPDPAGRLLAAKDLRLTPTVTGTFTHVINAGERLDQLSYRYYGQPLQWWNICDANPDFISPLSLLGSEPVVISSFTVETSAGAPPWAAALQALAAIVGVNEVDIAEDVELKPESIQVDGQPITTFVEHYTRAIRVTYNRINVTDDKLMDAIEGAGFTVSTAIRLDRIGQEIIIPPKPVG